MTLEIPEQLDRALEGLAGGPGTTWRCSTRRPAGRRWRARAHLARQEFSPARVLLEQAIGLAPEAVWPRLLLSRVFLQEGRELAAAEAALRALLVVDPNQREARNNLDALLRQEGALATRFRRRHEDRTAPPAGVPPSGGI